jgi:hypothetical protein
MTGYIPERSYPSHRPAGPAGAPGDQGAAARLNARDSSEIWLGVTVVAACALQAIRPRPTSAQESAGALGRNYVRPRPPHSLDARRNSVPAEGGRRNGFGQRGRLRVSVGD